MSYNSYKLKQFYILLLLVYLPHLEAQNPVNDNGIRSLGLGGAGLNDLHSASLWQNPALLSNAKGWQFSTEYFRPIYLVSVGLGSATIVKGNGKRGFALGFSRLGVSSMTDQTISAAYALKLNDRIKLGVRLDWNQLYALSGMASSHYFTGGVGVHYKLNEKLQLGAFVFNPNRSPFQLEDAVYRSISSWEIGLKHLISDRINWYLEAAQEQGFSEIDWQSGLEYMPLEGFQLQFGYRSIASKYSVGFSFKKQNWKISLASAWHPDLGFGGGIGLEYALD